MANGARNVSAIAIMVVGIPWLATLFGIQDGLCRNFGVWCAAQGNAPPREQPAQPPDPSIDDISVVPPDASPRGPPSITGRWVVEGQDCRYAVALSLARDILTIDAQHAARMTEVVVSHVSDEDVATRSAHYFRRGGNLVIAANGDEQVFSPCQ